MIQQLLGSLVHEAEEAVDEYAKQVQMGLERYARGLVFGLVKLLAVSTLSLVLLSTGALLALASVIALLSTFLPFWQALGIVGWVTLAVGGSLLLVARRMAHTAGTGLRKRQASGR